MIGIVHTESGAVYEFEAGRVRRANPAHGKRGDGDWQVLVSQYPETPTVGTRMVLVMESLRRYGGDDQGTPDHMASDVTTRTTTPVSRIEERVSASTEES